MRFAYWHWYFLRPLYLSICWLSSLRRDAIVLPNQTIFGFPFQSIMINFIHIEWAEIEGMTKKGGRNWEDDGEGNLSEYKQDKKWRQKKKWIGFSLVKGWNKASLRMCSLWCLTHCLSLISWSYASLPHSWSVHFICVDRGIRQRRRGEPRDWINFLRLLQQKTSPSRPFFSSLILNPILWCSTSARQLRKRS